jgi:hypothetical protein
MIVAILKSQILRGDQISETTIQRMTSCSTNSRIRQCSWKAGPGNLRALLGNMVWLIAPTKRRMRARLRISNAVSFVIGNAFALAYMAFRLPQ